MKYDVTVERTITQELVFTVEADNCHQAAVIAEHLGRKTESFIDVPVTARGHHAVVMVEAVVLAALGYPLKPLIKPRVPPEDK